ncbi:MAG: EMC3/TMCO1 family protein [Candidatus Aenigmatarchaeota archaeon]
MFSDLLNAIFAPLLSQGLFIGVTIISVLASSITTLFYRFFVDQTTMKDVRKNMELYRELANAAQKENNVGKMNENVDKMMKLNKQYFSLSTKPMILSLLVFAVIFPWMGQTFLNVVVNLPFTLPFIGNTTGWFGWYFLLAIPSSIVMRKLLDLE